MSGEQSGSGKSFGEAGERLTEDQVLNLLKMCDIIPRCDDKKNRSVLVTIRRFKSYDTKTILRRFFRSALLRLAGAVGTSICSSVFGGAAGVSLGALVSIPPESVLEIDISGRAYVVFYDHAYDNKITRKSTGTQSRSQF